MRRIAKVLAAGLCVALALGATAAAAIWWLLPEPSRDEVARSRAPDGSVDAVLVEVNGGATVSFGYDVFLVPAGGSELGQPVAKLYGAVRNANAYGANLHWVSGGELHVEFESAESSNLAQPLVTVAGKAVRVGLQSGVTDTSAARGGMLYNRGGRQ